MGTHKYSSGLQSWIGLYNRSQRPLYRAHWYCKINITKYYLIIDWISGFFKNNELTFEEYLGGGKHKFLSQTGWPFLSATNHSEAGQCPSKLVLQQIKIPLHLFITFLNQIICIWHICRNLLPRERTWKWLDGKESGPTFNPAKSHHSLTSINI